MVKAKHGLPDKSRAINLMALQYEEEILEPEFKPEYITRLKKIVKGRHVKVKNFAKHLGLEK